MARKLYTVDVEDEKLKNSASSKNAKLVKSSAEQEVENYGIVEINNNSAKKRVKNAKDLGFEKNNTETLKKSVKSKVSTVEDYFDFSFRPSAKVETKAKVVSRRAEKTAKAEAAFSAQTEEVIRQTIQLAEVAEHAALDERAEHVVCVARMGSLFE